MRLITLLAILCLFQPAMRGIVPVGLIKFHNETTDTTRITEMLIEAENISDPNERIITLAKKFDGVPYVASTLENADGEEQLTVNLDERLHHVCRCGTLSGLHCRTTPLLMA